MSSGNDDKAARCSLRYSRQKQKGAPGWTPDYERKEQRLDAFLQRWQIPTGARVLEIGCGAGNTALCMAQKGFEAYGIDIAEEGIAWAREKAQELGVRASFDVGSVTELAPFKDSFFDVVYDPDCMFMITGEDRARCMASVFRVLKPGGFFNPEAQELNEHITEPYPDSKEAAISGGWVDVERQTLFHGDIPMYWLSREKEFVQEVWDAGFEIVSFEKTADDPNRTPDPCDPCRKSLMFAVARKPAE